MAGAAGSVEAGGADVGEVIGARIDWPEVVAGSLDAVMLPR
jgi:hypothetical protein